MIKPLAIDIYCGLGGWTSGLLAEGYDVIGFDIERHVYGDHRYPAQLVLQDVLTLHGSQFRDAALIVASPPCQGYSYRAMPWKRAKALPPPDNSLFEACFRIQREACEAAGRHIPLVVENVRGAQPWVGQAAANYGSFYLWGDVPVPQRGLFGDEPRQRFTFGRAFKSSGMNWSDPTKRGQDFTRIAGRQAMMCDCQCPEPVSGPAMISMECPVHNWDPAPSPDGRKVGKDWFGGYGGGFGWDCSPMRRGNSKSPARKFASAMIAKIPEPLSRHIARVYRPDQSANSLFPD